MARSASRVAVYTAAVVAGRVGTARATAVRPSVRRRAARARATIRLLTQQAFEQTGDSAELMRRSEITNKERLVGLTRLAVGFRTVSGAVGVLKPRLCSKRALRHP